MTTLSKPSQAVLARVEFDNDFVHLVVNQCGFLRQASINAAGIAMRRENNRLLPVIRELLELVERQREALASPMMHECYVCRATEIADEAIALTDETLKKLGQG